MNIIKSIVAVVVLVACLGMPIPASAANGDERIKSFDSQVLIDSSNVAHIRETIEYDFGQTARHGIYRDIPIDYKDGDDNFYITAKHEGTVDEDGQAIDVETDEVNGNLRLKIGDANRTVTGLHSYIITYTLSPVVSQKNNKQFLNLDLLGSGWQVPVDQFTATVSIDGDGNELSNIVWYGANGIGSSAYKENIQPYQAVTINANLPNGYVNEFLEPNKQRPFDVWKFLVIIGVFGGVAIIFLTIGSVFIYRQWEADRKRKQQTVIPEYDPPKSMTPAQIGLLDDDTAAMREITATVINWAVHGYIKITRTEKTGWWSSASYTLTQLKSGSKLPQAEGLLYEAFFTKGKEVALKDLDKTVMAAAIAAYNSTLKEQLSEKGYYHKGGNVLTKGTLTDAGAKEWAKAEGFQMYLSVVEKDRLNFSDAPEKTPERFNKLLPYAVALGVEKQWAKQFEGIDITSATSWYSGNLAAFSAVSLASDMGTSFANTVSSNSSYSSSGGSSGGGVGGGGGGSW